MSERKHYDGWRADRFAVALSWSEMPPAKSGDGAGGERFQVAQNSYRIELPLLADIGIENDAAVCVGFGWMHGFDSNDWKSSAVVGLFSSRISGSVFVIVDC